MINHSLHTPAAAGKKTCIIIAGPTAVGKTAIAVQLAQHFSTEIISCDSRQCFKELNIGVAKPPPEDLAAVPHHFINSHSIHDTINAAVFENYALEKINQIFQQHDVAVMVGGTGLYIKAFCDGMDEVPQIDEGTRKFINDTYQQNGLEWLQQQVKGSDPLYFEKAEIQNPHRLLRALEVKLSTGRSILEFHTRKKKKRNFDIIKVGLELPRPELVQRINSRVDSMMQEGLLEEVKGLLAFQQLNALQTVGYRELFSFLNNQTSLDEALEAIKLNTRHYAKRQMTWFKKDDEISWAAPAYPAVLSKIQSFIPSPI
jgi:tRNA dimethylallyltransferase